MFEVVKIVISLGVRSCTVDGVAQPAKAYEATDEREGLLGSEEEGASEQAAQNSSVYSSNTRVRDCKCSRSLLRRLWGRRKKAAAQTRGVRRCARTLPLPR